MSVIRLIAVYLFCFMCLECSAQIVYPGPCPEVTSMSDFNMDRYLGKWYENEKYFSVFELGGRCITATYKMKDNGVVAIINRQISSFTGMHFEIVGEVDHMSRSDESKLWVSFPTLPINLDAPHWVLDTDYDNYALVLSCFDLGFAHTRNAWIMTRERNPPLSTLENAYAAADRNNNVINRSYFMRTDQRNCADEE